MQLAKLTISKCDKDGNIKDKDKAFSAMVNPQSITVNDSVRYVTQGQAKKNPKYAESGEYSVSIPALILDTTGVIPQSEWPKGTKTILEMVNALNGVVRAFDSTDHQPSVVRLQWGPFIMVTRLQSMKIQYTLFNPEGQPVRASISLNFCGFKSLKMICKEENKQSPDLTHLVEVQVGDSLPLMCERVYKDPSLYLQVAKANNLTSFRSLKPGSKLYFPPIVD